MQTPQLATFKLPAVRNEPMYNYAPGSAERQKLRSAIDRMYAAAPFEVPIVINGKELRPSEGKKLESQPMPSEHKKLLCKYETADASLTKKAIEGALAARDAWEAMPFNDRAAIFLKAADLVSTKYRYDLMAATMLGQGKNIWQAEIDAAAELADFLRFNADYAQDLYKNQPLMNAEGVWNRSEFRALEGFVYAISPFNFTAICGNLAAAPALMGNVVVWKPSPSATYSNYLVYKIFEEAGLPDGVIQFIPGDAQEITREVLSHPDFASLHFTGSTHVFRQIWKDIGERIHTYRSYPRIVGETGGKNFHLVHPSADPEVIVHQSIRAAFEFQGQKCSALSRLYCPESLWPKVRAGLEREVKAISLGDVRNFENFSTPVIHQAAFDRIRGYIEHAKSADGVELVAGGSCDDSVGYFVQPTVFVTKDPHYRTMTEEIFGPVLTAYVYPDDQFEATCDLINSSTGYALTGAIFSKDRQAVILASNKLRTAAGNFYINDKCTGAVVGQQPFGGARASGTNDKAGAPSLLLRFVSARSIKESFLPLEHWIYPSNVKD
ncbi:MAG: 1-pyrroline-5-carboxylate dehydrogenase [Piptocephalis tieghemiana]|nr:MAG: 1-pyrroline-5-carboxylate dehydrogenase [Piptocephalis tieghemiana]